VTILTVDRKEFEKKVGDWNTYKIMKGGRFKYL